jgi:hypothetical protein
LPPEEQLRVLRQAEKIGPLPTDTDWIVAYAASQAAARIEAAAAAYEAQIKHQTQQAPRESGRGVYHSTCVTLWAFALSLGTFSLVAYFVVRFSSAHIQAIVLYCAALALGVSASAVYAWASPRFFRW